MHEFDPPGVGARDLKECLLIQAKHLEEDTNDLVHLLNNHMKDLEKKMVFMVKQQFFCKFY